MDRLVKIGEQYFNPRYIKTVRKLLTCHAIEINLDGEPERYRVLCESEATRDEAFDAIAALLTPDL